MQITEVRPFFQSYFYGYLEPNQEIIDNVYSIMESEEGRTLSNAGGWQSNDYFRDSHSWMKEPVEKFGEIISKELYPLYGLDNEPNFMNYWFNVNRRNDYNRLHCHPNSKFSVSWYLKVPQNSGKFVFERSDKSVNEWFDTNKGDYTVQHWEIQPEPGLFIIFPSYLYHQVEPSKSDEDRISVAFNYTRFK
jgi:uncharacterized protein (TIGR02466 family)